MPELTGNVRFTVTVGSLQFTIDGQLPTQPTASIPYAVTVGEQSGNGQARGLGFAYFNESNFDVAASWPGSLGTSGFSISGLNLALSRGTALSPLIYAPLPGNIQLSQGAKVTLEIGALGSGLTYAWTKDGTALSGATGPSYTIESVAESDAGTYEVIVTNAANTTGVPSTATVTVTPSPVLTTPLPANRSLSTGATLNLTVVAQGAGLTYAWTKNGTALSGATGPSYTIQTVATTDAGTYTVTVTSTNTGATPVTSSCVVTVS